MTDTKAHASYQSDMKSDLDGALQLMSNYPPEQRTSTLLFLLLRNDGARAAVSSILRAEC